MVLKVGNKKGAETQECWNVESILHPEFSALSTTCSGQIIATSHDLTPNGGLVREIPLFQGNPGW